MKDEDILHIEAAEIMRQASTEMLELSVLEELDLNAVARQELSYRAYCRKQRNPVRAMVREFSGL